MKIINSAKISKDNKFIKKALGEAKKALARGDFPVGAVLVINGKLIGAANNALLSKKSWGHHAETQLLLTNSQIIRKLQNQNPKTKLELFSTLEPCLMCLGCAIMHRVNRIVFSCPDPRGGATNVTLKGLPSFYYDNWPVIKAGIFKEQSYRMIKKFLEKQTSKQWVINKKMFQQMASRWEK